VYRDYTKIKNSFNSVEIDPSYAKTNWLEHIEKILEYQFENPSILYIALTHKSKSQYKKNTIVDDYNMLEFLGDSIIKMFNCKRIIKIKDELLKNKEKDFTDIQRLKFIKINSEKNDLFSLICIDTEIYKFIRYDTNNRDMIEKYAEYINKIKEKNKKRKNNIPCGHLGEDLELDDVIDFQIKMLADVIESIIGAIMFD
jgi:dsRNA-specific ribonuclease